MTTRSPSIGADQPITVRVGDLSATFHRGMLRWLRSGEVEIIRGIYGAVRDAEWGTVAATFPAYDLIHDRDRAELSFTSVHRRPGISFTWRGHIVIESSGHVRFDLNGVAQETFLRNRIGLCVLHPPELAGTALRAQTAEAPSEYRFPDLITADPPLTDISLLQQDPGGERDATFRFTGELFEMEDQRAWTDASFKTFGTPSALPSPVTIDAGTRVDQSIDIDVVPPDRPGKPAAPRRGAARRATVWAEALSRLPIIGTSAAPDVPVTAEATDAARFGSIAHLRVMAERDGPFANSLDKGLTQARSANLPVELGIVAESRDEIQAALAEVRRTGIELARVSVFDRVSLATTSELVRELRALLAAHSWSHVPVGGGSRADLAELIAVARPEGIDFVTYRVTPQIHAADDETILENLAGIEPTVRTARALTGVDRVVISPLALAQDRNPYARPVVGPIDPSTRSDVRQQTMFGAVWAIGALHALTRLRVESATIAEMVGPAGLWHHGAASPMLVALRSLAGLVGTDGFVRSFASNGVVVFGSTDQRSLLIANTSSLAATLPLPPRRMATGIHLMGAAGEWLASDLETNELDLPPSSVLSCAMHPAGRSRAR